MQQRRFAGVDWADKDHAACVWTKPIGSLRDVVIGVTNAGSHRCGKRLLALEVILVAIERPDGLLIDRLLGTGLAVIAVQPTS